MKKKLSKLIALTAMFALILVIVKSSARSVVLRQN